VKVGREKKKGCSSFFPHKKRKGKEKTAPRQFSVLQFFKNFATRLFFLQTQQRKKKGRALGRKKPPNLKYLTNNATSEENFHKIKATNIDYVACG